MSTLGAQADGLKNLARILRTQHLVKSGARESEAKHLIDMLKDAAETLRELENESQ